MLALGVALLAAAASQAAKGRVLGAAKPASPSCPDNCLVEARVTGFQTAIGRRKNPFRVPAHGRIVAWSIKLGEPVKEDIRFFNRSFGASAARLSILKPVRAKNGKRKYRLVRQTAAVRMRPFFGEVTTFGLSKPLRVRRGQIVALTTPSWLPAFARGQGTSRWRSSRVAGRRGPCESARGAANIKAGGPHVKRGTQRSYGCGYRGSRLLYSARFVPDKDGG